MTNSQNKPFTILIEGNIGVGKSTFLKYFNRFCGVRIVEEPVKKWQNLNGANLLDLMYKDTEKWGFPFQSYTILLMLENHTKTMGENVKVMERSIFSARYCFIEILLENNKIKKEEYDILHKWYEYIDKNINLNPNLIIYLRAPPEKVFERIKERERQEESNIAFDYIYRLHELHEDWLVHRKYGHSIPVLILDASVSADEVQKEFGRVKDKFTSHLNN